MEQQFQEPDVTVPARTKRGIVKMIIVNVIISALVALVVFVIAVGPLTNRVKVLEQKMDKLTSVYKVK